MEPLRLLDSDDGGFSVQLLRTARRDAPPAEAMNRAALALGLGVSLTAVTATSAAGAVSGATAHATAAAQTMATVTKLGALTIVKWVGVGVVSGLVVTGGLRYGTDPVLRATLSGHHAEQVATGPKRAAAPRGDLGLTPRPEDPGAQTPAAGVAEENVVAFPSVEADVARVPRAARPSTPPLPARERAALAVEPPHPAQNVEPPAESAHVATLSEELAILERARHALAARRPDAVLRELDAYSHMPRTGMLETEADMLAIEALMQSGDLGSARARAARSLSGAPNGPHAARLREILGGS